MKKLKKKLALDTQTIALLSDADLRAASGGAMTSRMCPASAHPISCVCDSTDCPIIK